MEIGLNWLIDLLLDSSLESVFAECQKEYNRLNTEFFSGQDETGKKLISDLEKNALRCEILIRREHIFSINETIKDISTGIELSKS